MMGGSSRKRIVWMFCEASEDCCPTEVNDSMACISQSVSM